MVLDSYVHDKEGHEYPVSVPVSFGSTFNFLLMIHKNSISTIHAFTITKTNENAFHLYSHIFYTVATSAMDKENGCTCNCEREKSMNHRILSTLALTKHSELHSENICILYDQNVNVQMSNMTFNGIKQSAQPEPAKPDRKMEAVEAITAMSYNIWNFNAYKQSNSHQGQYAARFKRISQVFLCKIFISRQSFVFVCTQSKCLNIYISNHFEIPLQNSGLDKAFNSIRREICIPLHSCF